MLLLYPATPMLWKHFGNTIAAVKIGWPRFIVTLVSMYVLPLTNPHRSHLRKSGLLPTKEVLLRKLGAVL